jgi:hypothetical protein
MFAHTACQPRQRRLELHVVDDVIEDVDSGHQVEAPSFQRSFRPCEVDHVKFPIGETRPQVRHGPRLDVDPNPLPDAQLAPEARIGSGPDPSFEQSPRCHAVTEQKASQRRQAKVTIRLAVEPLAQPGVAHGRKLARVFAV